MNKKTEIEIVIISILLRSPELILTAHIEPRWFDEYRRIIAGMLEMSGNGLTIDVFSVRDFVKTVDLQLLVHWQRNALGANENLDYYVKYLKHIYINQGIKTEFETALEKLNKGGKTKECLSHFMSNINVLSNADGKNYQYDMKEALNHFVDRLQTVFDRGQDQGLTTGMKEVDEMIGGIQETDLMVVGARPAVGKTSWSLSVINHLLPKQKRVGFFSTEMSADQIMSGLISMNTGINRMRLRTAELEDHELTLITAASVRLKDYSLNLYDKPNISVSEIMLQSRAWAMVEKLDLIVIDYLTRLKPDVKNQNRNLEVGEIITSLKNLARTLKVPVIVLAQLNREVEKRGDKRPKMSDLRDSGIIEQEADQILLLHRPTDEPDDESDTNSFADKYQRKPKYKQSTGDEIIVEKNRNGLTGICRVVFNPTTTQWKDFRHE